MPSPSGALPDSAARITPDWLGDPAVRQVMAALGPGGGYFVGGCVRDALLGRPVGDLDMATPLMPDTVTARARAAGLKAVPTGIEHGTVTLVALGTPFEVTSFRRDVETDGRHARVAFTDDMAEDARRRDFTLNALYADAEGRVFDPLGGMEDLRAQRVRFVGDPDERIGEDHLRILRFFRFHAWLGAPGTPPDAAGRAACGRHAAGVDALSRERVGAELRKLLAAPDPVAALVAMAGCGVLARLLPGADPAALPALVAAERRLGAAPDWRLRLHLLLGGETAAAGAALRLSKAEGGALAALGRAVARLLPDAPPETPPATPPGIPLAGFAASAHLDGAEAACGAALLAAARGLVLPEAFADEIARGAAAQFPLGGRDLCPPLSPGPELGRVLAALRAAWIASDFTLDAAALRQRALDGAARDTARDSAPSRRSDV